MRVIRDEEKREKERLKMLNVTIYIIKNIGSLLN